MTDIVPTADGKTQTLDLDRNVAACLCYVPISPINLIASVLWLATEPTDSRFVRFHAAQALLLAAAGVVLLTVGSLIVTIVGTIVNVVLDGGVIGAMFGVLASLVLFAGVAALLVADLLGAWKAFSGEYFRFPIIGRLAERFVG